MITRSAKFDSWYHIIIYISILAASQKDAIQVSVSLVLILHLKFYETKLLAKYTELTGSCCTCLVCGMFLALSALLSSSNS